MFRKYFQVLLLLGISLGSLANSDSIQCENPNWILQGYQMDACYFCREYNEIQTWCRRYLDGEDPAPLPCCGSEDGSYNYQTEISTEEPADQPDYDTYYDVYDDYRDYEEYSGFESYDPLDEIEEIPDPDDFEGFYNFDFDSSDSDSDSDDEDFPGSDLNDDEFAGPITNDGIERNPILPLPDSLEDSGAIVSVPPSPVDFSVPTDCFLADILGNNYIDGIYDAQQQCISDLKIKLREELNSFLGDVSDTKANFETFLEQHADELTEGELGEVHTQMSELDTKVTERSQRMGSQLQNPDCSEYTGIVREDALLLAANEFGEVEKQDESEAGNQLICVEDYLRGLQTALEECESTLLSVFQKILHPDQTKLIYDQMCRNTDVLRVREIVNAFFEELDYESTYPTPVIEPEYLPDDSVDTAEEMELRRTEIGEELEQLQQEQDQAAVEKDLIFNNLVNVSDWRVYVEERLLELEQTGESYSEEGQRLTAELSALLAQETKWKSELKIIQGLLGEINEEMQILLSEELRLEMQLGILPEEEPSTVPDAADGFVNILGPGPVIIEEIPTDPEEGTEDRIEKIPLPPSSPLIEDIDELIDSQFTAKPREGKHSRKLPIYAIGALVGVMLLLSALLLSLCIPLLVLVSRRKGKKVPYDKASLAEKDPALLLKQTGFENPIYKFYAETSSKEDN